MMLVNSVEEYDSIRALLRFLHKLGVPSAQKVNKEIHSEYGHEFELCEMCQVPKFDCYCSYDEDYHADYFDDRDYNMNREEEKEKP